MVVSSDPVTLSDGNLAFITKDYSDGTNLNIVLSVIDGDDFTKLYQATLGTYSQTQDVVISVAAKDTGVGLGRMWLIKALISLPQATLFRLSQAL